IEIMREPARRKRIRLVERNQNMLPPVSADRGLLTKAIMHLVENAVKYSPERSSVIISTLMDTEFLNVEVEDRGYGIPTEEQEKIWTKFYRIARDGHDKEEESTGLGLSVVKEIMQKHRGDAQVVSEVGRGSRFRLRIPRL
ncbi:MAG: sensor histidine kinase, partial [Pyrinomonadaceae bacterium]